MNGSSTRPSQLEPRTRDAASEVALAREAATGDPRAQRLLLDGLLDRVRVTVRYLSGDHRDQDDWVQLALMEILRAVAGFRGESSLAAWADRIAIRTAMRQLKLRRRRDGRVTLDPEAAPSPGPGPGLEHDRLAMRRRLARHLGALDPECRAVVVLKLVHGHSIDEVAALTEAPPNTVRDRLARGRRLLRGKLSADPAFETLLPRRRA
ncbi:MAG TPA: RNA polymerase sigma factor [Polyangia bacterium]|nr:RNA polymerase sigma factor [Polyangia bacterium]